MGRPRAAGQPPHVAIGENLSRERAAAGLTQQQLAEAIGCDQTVISRLECGTAILTAHRAREIALALGVSVDRLIGESPAAA